MTDVVDSDELLRRIQRARACAVQEEQTWRRRTDELSGSDPEEARTAEVRTLAYEAVLTVLDEILTPGKHTGQG
ncbi:hypothetical protein AB0K80_33735 [Streptomyces sp. NPDC052682]|uniref:hypothetical protein n=1 Tax=Streptomyces sp. NPDC052682 TaxID=3154954 RepID=UPI003449FB68